MSRLATATAVALLALAVSACGSGTTNTGSGSSTTSSSPSSGTASGEAVAWADKVCKSVESEIGTLTQEPKIDLSNAASARAGLTKFLDDFGTALDRLIGGIKGAGEPPVPDGKQVSDTAVRQFEQAQQIVSDAKTKLSQVPANDPAALKQAFTDVGQQLTTVGSLDATKDMRDVPELEDAFKKAETCKKLDQQKPSSAPTS
jgi:hypothetical protein